MPIEIEATIVVDGDILATEPKEYGRRGIHKIPIRETPHRQYRMFNTENAVVMGVPAAAAVFEVAQQHLNQWCREIASYGEAACRHVLARKPLDLMPEQEKYAFVMTLGLPMEPMFPASGGFWSLRTRNSVGMFYADDLLIVVERLGDSTEVQKYQIDLAEWSRRAMMAGYIPAP